MMSLSKFISAGFVFITFLASVTYGEESGSPHDKHLRGAGGVVQSNRVDIQHSNIGGPMHMKLINNHVKGEGAITPDSSLSPTELPTFVPTEAPTEVPTESPTDVTTKIPTEQPTQQPTEMPTEMLSGNASCGCSDTSTEVVERVSPTTGRVWMDRNLGASRKPTSRTDSYAYGCLYQWGRSLDGAASMLWTSPTAGTGVTGTAPGPVNKTFPACTDDEPFITFASFPQDWLDPQNDTLWDTGSPLDPCPAGYQLPNATEWELEVAGIANRTEAYDKLGLPSAGFRKDENGVERSAGVTSFYWSRTAAAGNNPGALAFLFNAGDVSVRSDGRAFGLSVRCIKMQ